MNRKRLILCALCCLVLAGFQACGTVKVPDEGLVSGYRRYDAPKGVSAPAAASPVTRTIGLKNEAALRYFAREEWPYNRGGSKDDLPQLGISLSGGGMRSAIFSIGVMKGLQELGVLDRADVLSSVSGGGYALSWYYVQSIYGLQPNEDPSHLFAVFDGKECIVSPGGWGAGDRKLTDLANCRYQRYLERHGELIGHSNTQAIRWLEYGVNGAETVVSAPFNIVLNGVFGMHANVAPMRFFYERGIGRVFHIVPDANGRRSDWDFSSADWTFFANPRKEVGKNADDWKRVAERIQGRLPLFVINTTAHIEDSKGYHSYDLRNRVFEFTPLRYGSDYFGYDTNLPITMNRAVAISGAAADSTLMHGNVSQMIASGANVDLGYYIDNFQVDQSYWTKVPESLVPFPVYPFLPHYQKDLGGSSIYLADGGHSENLGAFSLVRRLCRKIVIVDSEHDPKYVFEGYHLLKDALRHEMGVELSVEQIDSAPRGASLRRALFGKNPVMKGTVSFFPYKDELVEIDVTYIKLSIDEDRVSQNRCREGGTAYYSCAIAEYYNDHKYSKGMDGDADSFPQQSTADQSYDRAQVKAYRDLGYDIVMRNRNVLLDLIKAKQTAEK